MANIKEELRRIKNAIFGREVRGSIHDGIKKMNDEVEVSTKKSDEAHEVMENIMQEGFDNAALESNFEQKLDDEIASLQPKWTGFKDDITTQLTETEADLESRAVNVKTFGAKGDGVTNDTLAIQSTIDEVANRGGGIVKIPAGHYRAKGIFVHSNVTVRGTGSSTIIETTSPGGYLFQSLGEVGKVIALSEDRSSGDASIKTSTSHNLELGDSIMIISQRNCLSDDAGSRWRLGKPTPNVTHAFFGEFKDVRDIVSERELIISSALHFPDYFKDNTRESSPYAAESAVIKKVSYIENARIEDMQVKGELSGVYHVKHGRNCLINNVEWSGGNNGGFVVFRESLSCEARSCVIDYTYEKSPSEHFSRNPLKAVSSHHCRFINCTVINSTQALDFTFDTGLICSAFNSMNGCNIIDARDNSATSHGGTYASIFKNNMMTGCRKGISTRSRNSQIANNVIIGNRSALSTYGISIFDGWSRDSIISNNTIIGFGRGVEITEDDGGNFDYNGAIIEGNIVQECYYGVHIRRWEDNKYAGDSNIKITNNTFKDFYGYGGTSGKGTRIDPYVHGVVFDGNTFILNEQVNGAIYVEANAGKFIVINNKFYSYEKTYTKAVWVENPTDSKLYPDGKTTAYYNGNDYNNVGKPDSENVNFILSSRDIYGIFPPAIDDKYSLGMSSRRWKSLYAKSGIIQTSDERQKQQTSVIPDSWLDAWRDVEYTRFKFNSSVNKKAIKQGGM